MHLLSIGRQSAVKLAASAGLLLAGVVLYLLWRGRNLLGFEVVDAMGLGQLADHWRSWAQGSTPHQFVLYCLPGGLWAASYVLLIDALFGQQSHQWRMSLAAVIPALGLGSELLQALHLLPGTADALDALCYALPFLIYALLAGRMSSTTRKTIQPA